MTEYIQEEVFPLENEGEKETVEVFVFHSGSHWLVIFSGNSWTDSVEVQIVKKYWYFVLSMKDSNLTDNLSIT